MRPTSRFVHSWKRRCCAGALAIGCWLVLIGVAFGVEWHREGTVLSLYPERKMVFLDHEAIEGRMPPMKMAFWVTSPDLLNDLKKGDRVLFSFTIDGSMIVINSITKDGE
ncbi:MAG: copper-binding protein [Candidatus Methylomirabilales bacterium]